MNYAAIKPEGSSERPGVRLPLRACARGEGGGKDLGTVPSVSQDLHDGHLKRT